VENAVALDWSIFLVLLIPCIFLHHRVRSSAGDARARTGSFDAHGTFVEALVNGVMWAAALTAILWCEDATTRAPRSSWLCRWMPEIHSQGG
jgi:hypothetical protein